MAVISIQGTPQTLKMRRAWSWNPMVNSFQSPEPVPQKVTFDLSPLGLKPDIQSVEIHAEFDKSTSYMSKVTVGKTSKAGNHSGKTQDYDFTEEKALIAKGGTLTASVTFVGQVPLRELSQTDTIVQTANATYTLVVTMAEDAQTDSRSDMELSAEAADFGGTITCTITPFQEAYTHTVTYQLGSHSSVSSLAAGVLTDSFELSNEWLDALPTTTSGEMKIILDTLRDGTSVGTKEYSLKVNVPAGIKPAAGNLSAEAVNSGALSGDARFFANASQAVLTLTGAQAGAGSTIKSVTFDGWGDSATVTALTYTTQAIQKNGTIELTATVTDNRGRTDKTSLSIVVYNYTAPYFNSIVVTRCDADGTPNDKGEAVTINASFGCATDVFQDNTATASVAFRTSGSETWSREYQLTNGVDTLVTPGTLLTTVSYDMRFTVSDLAMSIMAYMSLASAQFIIHFANNGRSVGIGQAAESLARNEAGRFAVNRDWTVYLGSNIYINNQTLVDYIKTVIQAST